MKVTFEKEYREIITVAELPAVKRVQKEMRDDESTAADYAAMAVRAIYGECDKVFEAGAEICRNSRVWDAFFNGSGALDIWIRFTARVNSYIIVEGGACLSDIWNIDGTDDARERMEEHAYIREFEFKEN